MIDLNISKITNDLFEFAKNKKITFNTLEKGLEISNYKPNKLEWKNFINILFLFLGISFLISGIIFFFAYNWNQISKFNKFAIIEISIIISTLITIIKKPYTNTGKAFLLVSIFLVGVLLAVFGQIYQTGADAYQLFAGWSILIIGWVIISNFLPIWTVFILLVNTSLILYWNQIVSARFGIQIKLYELLTIINFLFLIGYEIFHNKKIDWTKGRWFPRIIYMSIGIYFILPLMVYIFDFDKAEKSDVITMFCPLLFILFISVSFFYYQKYKKDLFILTIALLTCIIILTSFIGKQIVQEAEAFIFLALIVIGQGAGAAFWLRNIHREWEREKCN